MSLSSAQLEAFSAVVEFGSFSKAAKKLGLTQSALSQRIGKLESELRTSLLIRETSGVRPTELGKNLARYCKAKDRLEGEVLDALRSSGGREVSGILKIAGFSSVMRSVVLPSLDSLVLSYPKVQIELTSAELYELPALLKSGQADFVLTQDPIEQAGVASRKIGYEEYVLIEPKNHACSDVFFDHDPEDETTIRFFRNQSKAPRVFRRSFLDEIYALIDAVERGWGKAVVPLHLIKDRKALRVRSELKSVSFGIFLNWYEQPYYSALQKWVLEDFIKNVAKNLAREN